MKKLASMAAKAPIKLYRTLVSPFFPPSCRFVPSCSEYAMESIDVHGPIRGSVYAIRRLLRCHPIKLLGGGSGYDPVPKAPSVKTSAHASCRHASHK